MNPLEQAEDDLWLFGTKGVYVYYDTVISVSVNGEVVWKNSASGVYVGRGNVVLELTEESKEIGTLVRRLSQVGFSEKTVTQS